MQLLAMIKDMTSSKEKRRLTRLIGEDVKGIKIAIPNYYMSDTLTKKDCIISIIDKLKTKG